MIGTLSRVFSRRFLPTFCRTTVVFVRFEPMYFARVSVSSSCVNYRRVLYGNSYKKNMNEKMSSDDEDEDDDQSEDEDGDDIVPARTQNRRKKTSEYMSDASDNENLEMDYNNVNFSYVTLPKGSKATRYLPVSQLQGHHGDCQRVEQERDLGPDQCLAPKRSELLKCTLTSLKRERKCIVKEFRRVKHIMEKGIMPKKIFFTQVSELIELNKDLGKIQLYRLHQDDIPSGMQNRSRPAFFGIFKVDDLYQMSRDVPNKNSLPVTLICDEMAHQREIINILTAAAVCNTSHILFTTDISHIFHNYTVHNIYSQNSINVEFSQSWSSIEKRFGGETSVFVLLTQLPKENELDIPMVDLTEIDFWKKKEIVIVVSKKLDDMALDFCTGRNAQIITIKEANKLFFRYLSLGATTFTILSQYKQKTKPKSETKVMNCFFF